METVDCDSGGDDLHDVNLVETDPLKDVDVDVDASRDVSLMSPATPDLQREAKVDRDLQQIGDSPTPETPPREVSEEGGEGVQWNGPVENGSNGSNGSNGEIEGSGSDKEVGDLVELMSTLNPMAKEFIPPQFRRQRSGGRVSAYGATGNRRNNFGQGRRMNNRTSVAQREEMIKRTVYVCDIDQQITEEHLAAIFSKCGQVVDCRICGDPNSVLRIAFIEYTNLECAMASLRMSGTILGYHPIRVLRSKTAIAPVNPTYLPRSEVEREICSRTIYCTNIDRKVTQLNVKNFFQSVCGEVCQLKLLGDHNHPTHICFVEFKLAQSAIMALNCSGVLLGSSPIRISPSKTPIRNRNNRHPAR